MNLWTKKDKPLLVLAPMAGYTDSAFRLICRQFGADVAVTELVSADAIAYGKFEVENQKLKFENGVLNYYKVEGNKNQNTADLLSFFEEERPLVVQLFGKYPEKFALAAEWISKNLKPDGIDINMGCPARKVVGSDHGAALLKNCDLAVEIVKAVKENTNLPVSVKTRLGWEDDDEILDFAPKLAAAGIDAIMVHGRTYKDGFKGKARWENIFKVKEILGDKIAVIGNGDIQENSKLKTQNSKILNPQQTTNIDNLNLKSQISKPGKPLHGRANLDGVAIGRAAFGKPWIFDDNFQLTTENLQVIIQKHAHLSYLTKGEHGIIEFRKHLLAYLKGLSNAKELRLQAVKIATLKDIQRIIEKI